MSVLSIKFATEALIVGISSLVMGLFLHYVLGHHAQHAESPTMKKEMIQLSIILFLTGVLLHLFYEVTKMNGWYCKNGNACITSSE
jgi:hypothetical protein